MTDPKYFARKVQRPRQAGTQTVAEVRHEADNVFDISSSNLVSNLTNTVQLRETC